MIHLRLSGGLGNQFFQLAAAAILSDRIGTKVFVHTEGLSRYDWKREPDSLFFLKNANWLITDQSKSSKIYNFISVYGRIGRYLPFIGISESNLWKNYALGSGCKTLFMDGYFQSGWAHDTFDDAVSIMQIDPLPVDIYDRLLKNEVVVHIRGKEFLRLTKFNIINENYYIKAFSESIKAGRSKFVIITDDLDYSSKLLHSVKEKISDISVRFLYSHNSIDDFQILRAASARIIGNSTFAWWATALGNNRAPTWAPNKHTIAFARDFWLRNELLIDC